MENDHPDLKFKSSGTDAVYLANVNIFFGVLFGLNVFIHDWREDKLGSQSVLQKCIDWFRQMYEGGLLGNRLHIAARHTARKDLDVQIQKILHYVAIFGDEADITALLNSGVVTRRSSKRTRKVTKPVTTN
ncbi:MAG TPA: hypothetical protein VJ550_10610 [Geomonas sp.]|nr:hypothetical protein [Geomonas sp.]